MKPFPFFSRTLCITLFLMLGLMSSAAVAQTRATAVIYPDLQEPFRSVLGAIIDGIQEQIKGPVKLFPLGDDFNASKLKGAIDHKHFSAIIALGKTGQTAAEQWQGDIPIIVGAQLLTPNKKDRGVSGISLAADPDMFFHYLAMIAPSVKRVHVVYSPKHSAWLLQYANEAANSLNLQLITYKSKDIKSSALLYRDILGKSRPGEDAIWLLPDPVAIDNRLILPLLLRGAWDQNILIFSSSPAHVRRGALFALFPDNKKMGMSLAKMAESIVDKGDVESSNIIPLRDVQAAINVRTAQHIGLDVTDEERQKFSLVFPAP